MDYLKQLAQAQAERETAKAAKAQKKTQEVHGTLELKDGKAYIVVDLFKIPEESSSGKSIMLTKFHKLIVAEGYGLKARVGLNISVPNPRG